MSMTCDLVQPTDGTVTGAPTRTAGLIVHLRCDTCRAPQDFWMPKRPDGKYPTPHAKRVAARKIGWRFEPVFSPASGRHRTLTICPQHAPTTTKPGLVLLDFTFDAATKPARP